LLGQVDWPLSGVGSQVAPQSEVVGVGEGVAVGLGVGERVGVGVLVEVHTAVADSSQPGPLWPFVVTLKVYVPGSDVVIVPPLLLFCV
jgi:hypothetical protein